MRTCALTLIFVFLSAQLVFADGAYIERKFQEGLTLRRSGKILESVRIFRDILNNDGDFPRVRLELARSYILSGKKELARKELKKVLEMNPPEPFRSSIERFLKETERSSSFGIDYSVGAMWSTNTNNAPESRDVTLFGSIPFRLDEGRQSDSAVVYSVGADYTVPVGEDFWWWTTTADFRSRDYTHEHGNDFQMAQISSGPVFRKGKFSWGVHGVSDYATYGSEQYFWGAGAGTKMSYRFSPGFMLYSSAMIKQREYQIRSGRTGQVSKLGAGVKKSFGQYWVDLGYQYWRENSEVKALSNDSHVLYCGVNRNFGRDWLARVTSSYVCSKYDYGEFVFGGKARDDERMRISLGLQRRVGKNGALCAEWSFLDNNSNLDIYEVRWAQEVYLGWRGWFK